MLSAGLASSNLSWDFSLARRAASFTSLNCSANCRLREREERNYTLSAGKIRKHLPPLHHEASYLSVWSVYFWVPLMFTLIHFRLELQLNGEKAVKVKSWTGISVTEGNTVVKLKCIFALFMHPLRAGMNIIWKMFKSKAKMLPWSSWDSPLQPHSPPLPQISSLLGDI